MSGSMKLGKARRIEQAMWVAGAVLFVGLVYRFGWATLMENLQLAGWGIVLVVAQEVLAFAANTLGWWWSFPSATVPPFRALLRARIAGDAFNYVTPTASLGGEFVRLQMLDTRYPRTAVVASLSVAKLAQTLGQVVFILAGLIFVAWQFALPRWVVIGAWAVATGFVLLCALLIWWQRRGMFVPLLRVLQRCGWLPSENWSAQIARLDVEIRRLHHEGTRFPAAVFAFAVGWALGVLEMYLVLWLLHVPPSLATAVAIEVFSATLDGILFFVPGKLGTQEGGKVWIFSVLALDPAHGLAAGVLRRIRELFWAGVGLALWWRHSWTTRPVVATPLP